MTFRDLRETMRERQFGFVWWWIALAMTGLAGVIGMVMPNDATTHAMLDFGGSCVAMSTLIVAGAGYFARRNPAVLIVGAVLAASGLADAYHTLTSYGYILDRVAPDESYLPGSWAIARFTNWALLMLGVVAYLLHGEQRFRMRSGRLIASTFLAAIASLGAMTALAYRTEVLTLFPESMLVRPYDGALLVLFAVSAFCVYPRFFKECDHPLSSAIWLSCIPDVATQAIMAFGSPQLFDAAFNAAHATKIVSYLIPLGAIAVDYRQSAIELVIREANEISAEMDEVEARTSALIDRLSS